MISPYIDQGTGVMRFDLPEKWRLKKVLEPSSSSNALDQASISNLIHKRLDSPAFNSKLEKSKNCVVMTDDVERPTPIHLLLSPLLSRLENHFDRDNIKVVVATGSHQTSNKDSIVKKLGKDVCDGFSVHIHSARDDGNMYLGETKQGTPVYIDGVVMSSDLKIGIGNTVSHPSAGFGGGPKIILPGVAGLETISRNHSLAVHPSVSLGKTYGNIMWEDILEASKMAGLDVKLDCVMDNSGNIIDLFFGDVETVHKQGIEVYEKAMGVPVQGMADVTVVSGCPVDINLVQSSKGIYIGDLTTKPGGTIVIVGGCKDGIGGGLEDQLRSGLSVDEMAGRIRDGKVDPTGGTSACLLKRILEGKEIMVVSKYLNHDLEELGFRHASGLDETFEVLKKERPEADVTVIPNKYIHPVVEDEIVV